MALSTLIANPDKTLDQYDLLEKLGCKLIHLDVLLMRTCGEDGDGLRSMSHDTQDNYHWACSSMARECKELHSLLQDHILQLKERSHA